MSATDVHHNRRLTTNVCVAGLRSTVHLSVNGELEGAYTSASFLFAPSQARQVAAALLEMADLLERAPDVLEPPPEGDGETSGYGPAALQR